MTIHGLDLAIGIAAGAILGALCAWKIGPFLQRRSDRRTLHREYHSLTGQYENFHITEDGVPEPTGETIEVAWDEQQSLLDATATLANGLSVWHSFIAMNLRYKGTGTGHYNNSNSIHGGILQLVYSRQARAFHVLAVSKVQKPVVQYWVRKL